MEVHALDHHRHFTPFFADGVPSHGPPSAPPLHMGIVDIPQTGIAGTSPEGTPTTKTCRDAINTYTYRGTAGTTPIGAPSGTRSISGDLPKRTPSMVVHTLDHHRTFTPFFADGVPSHGPPSAPGQHPVSTRSSPRSAHGLVHIEKSSEKASDFWTKALSSCLSMDRHRQILNCL